MDRRTLFAVGSFGVSAILTAIGTYAALVISAIVVVLPVVLAFAG